MEPNIESVPVFLYPCEKPVGSLVCGHGFLVLERDGLWLKIDTPDGITRYIKSLSASQATAKRVPFDEHSGIPEGRAPDCSLPIYKIGGDVSAPHLVYNPNPEYSEEARKAKYQGTCILRLTVGEDGRPSDIKVARGLGHGLDEKAVEAVRQWKFTPAMKKGKPVPVQISVEVTFRLYNQPNARP